MKPLLVPVLAATVVALAAPAHAQFGASSRPTYTDEVRQPYYESRRIAYDNGYREGLKEGEKDGRKRAAFDYQRQRTWHRADKGYHRTFGDLERYRQSFRTGYTAGYTDAYRRFSPDRGYYGASGRAVPRRTPVPVQTYPQRTPGAYGRHPGTVYRGDSYAFSAAFANGVNDGYEKGRNDARSRNAYDPLRHKWYRSADRHYRNEYGSKAQYRDIYRQGFREGYDRAYREGIYRR